MARFMRQVVTQCGEDYREVDIFPITEREKKSTIRAKKTQASRMVQQTLNGKNAKRYLRQLINTNFGKNDLHVTLTYSDAMLPKTEQQALHDIDLFLRRLKYACKKAGKAAPKYIAVCEWREPQEGETKGVRYHHHVILSCALGRDEIEALWTRNGEVLGFANADRLQLDNSSLEALASYLLKYTNRKRRWKQSRGLKKPKRKRPNDSAWTQRKVARMAKDGSAFDREMWRKKFPGWELNEAEPVYNECTGEWSMYLKLRRIAVLR